MVRQRAPPFLCRDLGSDASPRRHASGLGLDQKAPADALRFPIDPQRPTVGVLEEWIDDLGADTVATTGRNLRRHYAHSIELLLLTRSVTVPTVST